MKTTINSIFAILLLCVSTCAIVACGDDDDKDMTPPAISSEGIEANPVNCQVYHRGDVIPFLYVFTDDVELGSFNIEIHDNSDHHSHSTEADDHDGSECDDEADHNHEDHHDHEAEGGEEHHWVYNQSFDIPEGLRSYRARFDISIPTDIEGGDYHFMIRLTDRAGWQQLKAVAIKIVE